MRAPKQPKPSRLPDPTRRSLLRAGAGALALPLLNACGSSDSAAGSGNNPSTGGECTLPTASGTQRPRGVHVSWTDDPATTRTLTWFTDGAADPGTLIQYGPVEDGMSDCEIQAAEFPYSAAGETRATYGVHALTHSATMTALDGNHPIRYRVGSETGGWSEARVLQPAAQDNFRFIHFGDHAQSDASRAVTAATRAKNPDFVWIAGDLSYANGDQPLWDSYFDMLEPLASEIPVMTAPGNHENKDGGGEGYTSRVSLPGNGIYYGFDYGNIHFCVSTGGSLLNDAADAGELLKELAALEADLADASRRRANGEIDFIIFVQHYTIWTSCEGRDPFNFSLVLLEENILLRHGVDLLLVGHDHIYERSKPMGLGLPLDSGYVQITQGGGGQSLYELVDYDVAWSAFRTLRHGFTEYVVEGKTIRGTTYSVENEALELLPDGGLEIIDSFEIHARSGLAKAQHVHPAKTLEELGRDFDLQAMVEHTVKRNHLHDLFEDHTPNF
jgi:hypothetical protein